jgi:hypothetical protein
MGLQFIELAASWLRDDLESAAIEFDLHGHAGIEYFP